MSGLLVSVKDQTEALASISGGTDILDIKDPQNGPLGMADPEIIESILDLAGQFKTVKSSVALGEMEEWTDSRPIPALLNRADYLKVGPGEFTDLSKWFAQLLGLVDRFRVAGVDQPAWIAVLYAESISGNFLRSAKQHDLDQLVVQLKKNDFAGLLIDTANKSSGSLRCYFNDDQLKEIITKLNSQNLLCSLAGRLSFEEIESMINHEIQPDYFAVRSAACIANDRQAEVEQDKVRGLKELITG